MADGRDLGWSSITINHPPRDVEDRAGAVWGVCLHTTGIGVNREASRQGVSLMDWAVRYYSRPAAFGPHYVIGHDGTIAQVANDFEKMPHIGLTPGDRLAYLNGNWTKKVPLPVVARWKQEWPTKDSPAHLYPSHFPNDDYVGIELIPTTGTEVKSAGAGLRFTRDQHGAAARLCVDIAKRHDFMGQWWRTGRLVGHEDVQLVARHDSGGGWDPGWLRIDGRPYFDMRAVRDTCGIIWQEPIS